MKPRETTVTLSTGQTVTVGIISWGAWCRLKERIAKMATQEVLSAAAENVIGPIDLQKIGERLQSDWETLIPPLVSTASSISDELAISLARGCVREELPVELGAIDVSRLRTAALDVNDFGELMASEKNWLREVVGAVAGRIGTSVDASPSGSDGNP